MTAPHPQAWTVDDPRRGKPVVVGAIVARFMVAMQADGPLEGQRLVRQRGLDGRRRIIAQPPQRPYLRAHVAP